MKEIVLSFSFIVSILIYIALALIFKNKLKPSFPFKTDISKFLYILFFFFYLLSLYISRFKTFQKKIIAFSIAEIPPILSFAYFFLTGNVDLLIKVSIISIIIIIYITFLKGENIEN